MPSLLTRKEIEDELAFVQRQLDKDSAPNDTLRLMWEQRRSVLREELANAEQEQRRAAVALLFEDSPVVRGSEQIRLDFATKALDTYQAVVSALVAERAGHELGARGRLPRSFGSKLFIQDMARGSVGFLLKEAEAGQSDLLPTPLHEAVEQATKILHDASEEGSSERFGELSPRTVDAFRSLVKVLHDAGAVITIVGNNQVVLSHRATSTLYALLKDIDIIERSEERAGMLLGILPERQQYEFKPADGSAVFYGPVSPALDTRYMADPLFASSILLKPAIARFTVRTTVRAGTRQREEWVLEDVQLPSGQLALLSG